MDKNSTIVVTGAAGFIGSCLTSHLNSLGYENLILVDVFGDEEKEKNLAGKKYMAKVDRDIFFTWHKSENVKPSCIFHLGACTDTTEFDYSKHQRLNVDYSMKIWQLCVENNIPLIYASSAATYGDGGMGYIDDQSLIDHLQPLNPYGISKNEFDKWALKQNHQPPFWTGLKFFNVYGPNEGHKGQMASMVFHSYNQVLKEGKVRLFRSHRNDFKDGEQLRDFVYVKDVIHICTWLMQHQPASGIYNLGTGQARTFIDLVNSVFAAMAKSPDIEFKDIPAEIREKYQYFTEAKMEKLKTVGYPGKFYSLEEGVEDYVRNYLARQKFY